MRAHKRPPSVTMAAPPPSDVEGFSDRILRQVLQVLDDGKAENILEIDLVGKTAIADRMVIASGRSDRHVGALASRVIEALKLQGTHSPRVEGLGLCDWVLIDAGDLLIHLFRPEVRGFYNLEKLWGAGRPLEGVSTASTDSRLQAG